jgi:hypothetical protein
LTEPAPAQDNRGMKILPLSLLRTLPVALAAAFIAVPCFAQDQPTTTSPTSVTTAPVAAPTGQPSEAEMMKQMMELSKLSDNHKLLASLAGTWTDTVKMWMSPDPKTPPMTSTGTVTRKPIMGGRFFVGEFTGKMKMPGPDGKLKDTEFKGTSLEGYDNAKQKFVSTWADNMGTGIMMSEGTYDPASKTFTYTSELEMVPGMKMKIREVVKIVDKDHHTFEWYEDHGGTEAKTMEINYTRQK